MDKSLPEDVVARIRQFEGEIETITQQSEKAINMNLAKHRRVIDATSEGFLELDLQFRVVDYNTTIVAMFHVKSSGKDAVGISSDME